MVTWHAKHTTLSPELVRRVTKTITCFKVEGFAHCRCFSGYGKKKNGYMCPVQYVKQLLIAIFYLEQKISFSINNLDIKLKNIFVLHNYWKGCIR